MWQSDFDITRALVRKELEPVLRALSILVRLSGANDAEIAEWHRAANLDRDDAK